MFFHQNRNPWMGLNGDVIQSNSIIIVTNWNEVETYISLWCSYNLNTRKSLKVSGIHVYTIYLYVSGCPIAIPLVKCGSCFSRGDTWQVQTRQSPFGCWMIWGANHTVDVVHQSNEETSSHTQIPTYVWYRICTAIMWPTQTVALTQSASPLTRATGGGRGRSGISA